MRTGPPPSSSSPGWPALAGAVLLGLALRLWLAGASEPWTDELYFAITAEGIPAELVTYAAALPEIWSNGLDAGAVLARTPRLAREAHPPLPLLLGAPFGHAAPPWVLRLPALAFASGTLWLVALWARRRMEPGAALAAVLLVSLAFPLAYHGAEARPYAAALFFGLATTLLAIGPARPAGYSACGYALYGVCAALGLYSHYYVGGLYPAQLAAAWLAARREPARRRHAVGLLLGLGLAALLFLPWVAVPLTKARAFASQGTPAGAPTAAQLLAACGTLLGGVARGWPAWLATAAAVWCLGTLVVGVRGWARRSPAAAWQLALAPLGITALALAAPRVHEFQPKHLAAAALPMLLAAAAAWPAAADNTTGSGQPGARGRRVARTAVAGLVALQLAVWASSAWRAREPWEAAWRAAQPALTAGDLLVFHPAHAKLAMHRSLALAGHRLFPADDRLRTAAAWRLPPLGLASLTDSDSEAYWVFDSPTLRAQPQALHVWLFGPHALPHPLSAPPELLRGYEGDILLEIGPVK